LKMADLSSPILMQHCAMGKTISKAKFEFMRADGQGQPIKYFEIEIENVLIGGIEPSIEPGTFLDEHVSLKFSRVKRRYTQQKISGGGGGSTVGGWDLATNRVAA
jgi:type VI secretion system secreted protein Hcp